MRSFIGLIAAIGAGAAGVAAVAVPAAGQTSRVVDCAKCHSNRDFLAGKGGSGGDSTLYVTPALLQNTVHQSLQCTDCHRGFQAGYPHNVPEIVTPCETCHEQEGRDWHASIHAANAETQGDAPTCVGCHGSHVVYGANDPRSPIYPLNVAAMCGRCHGDARIIGKYFAGPEKLQARIATVQFPKSVHGAALTRDGLIVSATCPDCHRAHKILPADSANSSVNRANIPATCGRCHVGIAEVFDSSAHGAAYPVQAGVAEGHPRPVCVDCHTAHGIVRADQPQWQLGVVKECGSCHEQLYETFFETYHGQVARLGFNLAAKCSDCHTAHNMRPATDPKSSVYPLNLVATCQQCHPAANANFVRYYPHPDPTSRTKYPTLFWPWLFMTGLLIGVMAFFGLHTVLWLVRLLVHRRGGGAPTSAGGPAPASGGGGQ
jgi:nitrate/TMAO reductase-like tetraheme cytochrome c subunit